tara:strand:- start:6133 stop:6987 length:855 start_codon:yes stop_codon:yes gene_type:complete
LLNWKKLNNKEKEKYLNPKASVKDHLKLQKLATEEAKKYRDKYKNKHLNIKYGKSEKQKLDIFVPINAKNSSVQVYFHGGYWIGRDKYDHSHIAQPAIKNNVIHVSVNYDLCPNVKLDVIVKQAQKSISWIYKNIKKYGGNKYKINLVGHSAGAHLVAMILTKKYKILSAKFINSATLISGIFQPEITKYISINSIIKLDEKTSEITNVYNYKIKNKTKVLVIVGANEPKAWISLSKDITKWLLKNNIKYNFLLAKNLNHFTMVKALANINSEVSKSTIAMIES